MERRIPDIIMDYVGDKSYQISSIGLSGAEVRIYEKYVLKIGPVSKETKQEALMVNWLGGRAFFPMIFVYFEENGMAYTLMHKVPGKMLCSAQYLSDPKLLIHLAAEGLKYLWSVDITFCPYDGSRLSKRLLEAERRVKEGMAEFDLNAALYGLSGIDSPERLLAYLKENQPAEDIVLTHGDYCLPNILAEEDRISGFIDLGRMGPADRWQDIALAIRSLHDNFSGKYSNGKMIFDFKPEMLLSELGMALDEEKLCYYLLLDML